MTAAKVRAHPRLHALGPRHRATRRYEAEPGRDGLALSCSRRVVRAARSHNATAGPATVLNEVYLAMGIPSRHITPAAMTQAIRIATVVNMVWSRELGKWLYMDPTHDAWFADAQGAPLSSAQVIQRGGGAAIR